MASPFPGMDPFIEGQIWEDFHHEFIGEIRHALVPLLPSRYVTLVEQRIYIDRIGDDSSGQLIADVSVIGQSSDQLSPQRSVATAGGPVLLEYPVAEERRESFLTVREAESRSVVTVIEILSPANKRQGSEGRTQYLEKRGSILSSDVNLVELDLLRGGRRLPMANPLPPASYYALARNPRRRSQAAVYPWNLVERMPPVPVPLLPSDDDVSLRLAEIFTSAYDRAGYGRIIDYQRAVKPPLSPEQARWAAEVLAALPRRL